jgi:hypothetical protein
MKITIENTANFAELDGVPARIWEGETDTGIPVIAFVTRISPQTNDAAALERFAAELTEVRPPSAAVEAIPLRLIL